MENGGYAGMVIVADAYAPENRTVGKTTVADLGANRGHDAHAGFLNAREKLRRTFQIAYAKNLPWSTVLKQKVMGLLTEQHLLRRYAEELDKARRDLRGEGESVHAERNPWRHRGVSGF